MDAIWAEDLQGIIGKQGQLPWHLPRDLAFFKEKTLGKTILMGRKTFEGMNCRCLPGRKSLVLTRNEKYTHPEAVILHNQEEVNAYIRTHSEEKIVVIGGRELFQQYLPLCSKVYRTLVEGSYHGDIKAPQLPTAFHCIQQSYVPKSEKNEVPLIFEVWQNEDLLY